MEERHSLSPLQRRGLSHPYRGERYSFPIYIQGLCLLSIETRKRLFSISEEERDGKVRRGQGQGKPRQALPVSCLALPRGVSLFSIETI